VDTEALCQVYLAELLFFPVSSIPPTLHTYPIMLFLQGQMGGAWEPSKQSAALGDIGTPPPHASSIHTDVSYDIAT